MDKKALNAKSLAELTAIYNEHADKPIKKFSGSKAEAIERVLKVLPKAAKAKNNKGISTSGPRTGVCAWMKAQHVKGVSAVDTFSVLHEHFPEAKTTLKTVRWYFNYLNQGA